MVSPAGGGVTAGSPLITAVADLQRGVPVSSVSALLGLHGLVAADATGSTADMPSWVATDALANLPAAGIGVQRLLPGEEGNLDFHTSRSRVITLSAYAAGVLPSDGPGPATNQTGWPPEEYGALRLTWAHRPNLRRREVLCTTLADWSANLLRAPSPGLAHDPSAGPCLFGADAYSAMARRTGQAHCNPLPCLHELLEDALLCQEYLAWRAGRATTPVGRRLRWAAEVLDGIVTGGLRPAIEAERVGSQGAASTSLKRVAQLHDDLVYHLLDALCLATGASVRLHEALLHPPTNPLDGMALSEVVYLARAGAAPYRALAARQLGASSEPQAIATLRQLLHDCDGRVVGAALESCRQHPEGLGYSLANSYLNDPSFVSHALLPRACLLISAGRRLPTREWIRLSDAVAQDGREEPEWTAIKEWAKPLLELPHVGG